MWRMFDIPTMAIFSRVAAGRMLEITRLAVPWLSRALAKCSFAVGSSAYDPILVPESEVLTCWDWCHPRSLEEQISQYLNCRLCHETIRTLGEPGHECVVAGH